MADYIVHKAVNVDKVKAKRRAILEQPGYLEREFIAQAKYDGCNMVCVYDGQDARFFSRTEEEVKSVEHIRMAICSYPNLPPGVYLGECWCPDASFAEISGWFRRHNTDEEAARLQFAIFDYIDPIEWDSGGSDLAYVDRVARIPESLGNIPQYLNPIWLAGSYGRIATTWSEHATAQQVCNKLVEAGGYDGLILRDPQGKWRKGDRGTNGEIIKIKRVLSFDLKIKGLEEGKGKHAGRMGAVIVDFNGQDLRVGTGFSDAERQEAWDNRNGPHHNAHYCSSKQWIGRIVEVEAMDYSEDGLLREPRFKGLRYDKAEPDA